MNKTVVPALDLNAHHAAIKDEILQAMAKVIEANAFILGPDVGQMEQDVARYCQVKHCIGVSSGSDALLLALMALDIRPGDEVITTPFTFFATVGAIARLGAKPVFVDIDPVTYNLNVYQIEKKITARTRGIIPVHLYGQCADMGPILDIAGRRNLFVIEDAAQAIGSEYHGQRAGSMGTVGCFSFFPSKNLGCFGDGGAVTTNNDVLAEKMKVLRIHGSKPKYYHRLIGGNFRLDTLQAAVVRVKLKYLDQWTAGRQWAAQRYDRLFEKTGLAGRLIETPRVVQNRHIFNQYVLRAAHRDQLQAHLTTQGIGNAIYYPLPLHLQECFAYLGHHKGDFLESERAALATLALPMFPELTEEQQQLVVYSVVQYYQSQGMLSEKRAA
jgi:dTDP-4-amino-4,6-dideoxygalactose transaminase